MSYAITAKGGTALHYVTGDMTDHTPWRDAVTTFCGRQLVAANYFTDLADYRASYNAAGAACTGCAKVAQAKAMLSPVVIRTFYAESGWCQSPEHSRFDHTRSESCVGFVSDAEHTAKLIADAAEHDRHNEGRKEAMYVAEHRPY